MSAGEAGSGHLFSECEIRGAATCIANLGERSYTGIGLNETVTVPSTGPVLFQIAHRDCSTFFFSGGDRKYQLLKEGKCENTSHLVLKLPRAPPQLNSTRDTASVGPDKADAHAAGAAVAGLSACTPGRSAQLPRLGLRPCASPGVRGCPPQRSALRWASPQRTRRRPHGGWGALGLAAANGDGGAAPFERARGGDGSMAAPPLVPGHGGREPPSAEQTEEKPIKGSTKQSEGRRWAGGRGRRQKAGRWTASQSPVTSRGAARLPNPPPC